jgi:hypothetical protein
MVSLSNWSLHSLTHRREIRNVASAFVGEIAAILHLIETHDVVSMLEKALDASDCAVALPNLTLPPFTIYTADAARLDELPLSAPRKIAYFSCADCLDPGRPYARDRACLGRLSRQ